MPTDYTLQVRQAVVAHLRSYAPLTDLISQSRIYGEQTPADVQWPFIRYGSTTLPFEATCWSGSQQNVDIHVFANGPFTDAVLRASAQVVAAMESWAPPAGTGIVDAEWLGNIGPLTDDAGPDKYHVVVQFRLTVA